MMIVANNVRLFFSEKLASKNHGEQHRNKSAMGLRFYRVFKGWGFSWGDPFLRDSQLEDPKNEGLFLFFLSSIVYVWWVPNLC